MKNTIINRMGIALICSFFLVLSACQGDFASSVAPRSGNSDGTPTTRPSDFVWDGRDNQDSASWTIDD